MSVIKINKGNFQNEVINSESTVLLDFYADWCGPCRMVSPIVDEIAEERVDIKVGKSMWTRKVSWQVSLESTAFPPLWL